MPVLLAQSIFRVWMLGYERYNLSSYQRNSCYAFLHYTCSISNKYWLTVYYVPHTVLGAEDSAGWQGNGNIELYSAFVLRCISASQKKWGKNLILWQCTPRVQWHYSRVLSCCPNIPPIPSYLTGVYIYQQQNEFSLFFPSVPSGNENNNFF